MRHGRSKEKRTDLPLVTLALTIDASGFPRCAKIYPGNIAEPNTLMEVITSMGVKRGTTIVLDAGIATKANLEYLSAKGLSWVTVDRSKPKELPKGQADSNFGVVRRDQVAFMGCIRRFDSKEDFMYIVKPGRK